MNWISVKDRLPEKDDVYIICLNSAYYDRDKGVIHYKMVYYAFWDYGHWDLEECYANEEDVTHWMPFPEPPEEDVAIPETQMLKKPTKCKVGYCQNNGSRDSYVVETKYHCPTCGAVVSEYTDFCQFCRQPLDWSEEKEECTKQ